MSSFFVAPSQKKRKRTAAPDVPKKRVAAGASSAGAASSSRLSHATGRKLSRTSTAKPAKKAKAAPSKKRAGKNDDDDNGRGGHSDDDDDEDDEDDDEDDYGRPRGGRVGDNDDDIDLAHGEDDSDLDEAETAAERRLRLAERYLENVRQEVEVAAGEDGDIYAFNAEDVDRDLIAERLQEDVAEAKGRVYRQLAGDLGFGRATHCLFRWNAKNVNAVAVCAPYAYTVSSDAYLTKWRIQERPEEQQRQRLEKRRQWEEARRQQKAKSRKRGGQHKAQAQAQATDRALAEAVASIPPRRQPERLLFRRGDPRRRRDRDYQGHVGAILTVAASQDGRFVVTGGADRRLIVWDAASLRPLRVFTHHRDAVTGLAFRRGTNQLYSCSKDRTIKIWSLDELAYVQTLFGHQDDVTAIDALAQEKCVSVGSRDRTARMWKVIEETQLVFRGGGSGGSDRPKKNAAAAAAAAAEATTTSTPADPNSLAHEGSMDCVAMLDDELFVTGSDNGALALWSTQKKKPLFVVPRAHGIGPILTGREQYDAALAEPGAKGEAARAHNPPPPPQPRWITALRTIPYSDVVFSGSWDGCVRVWRLTKDKRKLEPAGVLGDAPAATNTPSSSSSAPSPPSFSVPGVVNDIAVFERGERGRDGLSVVVAVGQEHRLGRWGQTEGARNGGVVFEVSKTGVPASGVNGVKE